MLFFPLGCFIVCSVNLGKFREAIAVARLTQNIILKTSKGRRTDIYRDSSGNTSLQGCTHAFTEAKLDYDAR